MKIWIFAALESTMAILRFAAFFWGNPVVLASLAAIVVAALGVTQPLISAHKGRKMDVYRDQQYQKSLDGLDEHIEKLLAESIDPPFPHRATVVAVLKRQFGEESAELLSQFDEIVESISTGKANSEALAAAFAQQVQPWAAGAYLQGLAALSVESGETAFGHFSKAKQQQSDWHAAWLGWAVAAFRLREWDEIREYHPNACGVELLPYDVGDED